MSERLPAHDSAPSAGAEFGSSFLTDDAEAMLGLRDIPEIKTVADFVAYQHRLTHEERERLAQRLGIGRPRVFRDDRDRIRQATPDELGVRVDATGKHLIDPDDPTLRDRDCDPDLYGKSPAEIVHILEKRETDPDDSDSDGFYASLMQREVKIEGHGGSDRGAKKKRPHGASQVDRAAIASVAGSLAS